MNLDSIETTTFHDRKPSHPAVPDAVLEAECKAAEAWRYRDLAFQQYQDGVGYYDVYRVLDEQARRLQDELEVARELRNGIIPEGNGPA